MTLRISRHAVLSTYFLAIVLSYFGSFAFLGRLQTRSLRDGQRSFSGSLLFDSKKPSNDLTKSDDSEYNYEDEEILLKVKVEGISFDDISRYCRAFPFSAVLPVQPLMYLPTQDGGVHVKFMRKKTAEKSSIDGGIRFFLESDDESRSVEITAKRFSEGQSVPKMFAEKLVVTNFVQALSGETEKYGQPPRDVTVQSLFHKWMDSDQL